MDCIQLDKSPNSIQLLTLADKISFLEIAWAKYHSKTDLFLPDDNFYDNVSGAESAEQMAASIFKWLGVKHRSLVFHIDPNQDKLLRYEKVGSRSQATLSLQVLQNPFLCGGLVAHAIVHHLLISRVKVNLDISYENELLTDLGTIHLGLGVLILNSLKSSDNALAIIAPANYVAECLDFFDARRLVPNVWQPYVLSKVINNYAADNVIKTPKKNFIKQYLATKQNHKNKLVLAGVAITLLSITGLFVLASQPKYLSAEQQSRMDEISILKKQYQSCASTVERKQSTWDTSDIFIKRQIEADQSRCTSIKNKYNYEVGRYNSSL